MTEHERPTPEEVAANVLKPFNMKSGRRSALNTAISVAIRHEREAADSRVAQARAEERERWVDIAEQHASIEGIAQTIRDAIRADGDGW
jgi:hypothetical protein